jgi:hypothetical protein
MREVFVQETPIGWVVQVIRPDQWETLGPMTERAAKDLSRKLEGEAS